MIGRSNKRIILSNYDQEISFYETNKGAGFGDANTYVHLFTGLAKIDVLSGTKALQYQQQGINNPVIIETNWMEELPSYILWNGIKIPITSFVDADEHFKRRVIMLGSYTK